MLNCCSDKSGYTLILASLSVGDLLDSLALFLTPTDRHDSLCKVQGTLIQLGDLASGE